MGNFLDIPVRERPDGTPSLVKEEEFILTINTDAITMFNKDISSNTTYIRLSCGTTLCASISYEQLTDILMDLGSKVLFLESKKTRKVEKKCKNLKK